jgi:uncharacterized protein
MRQLTSFMLVGLSSTTLFTGCATTNAVRQDPLPNASSSVKSQPRFIYFIHPTRDGFVEAPTPKEQSAVGDHFNYLKRLVAKGTVLLAGPSTDPPYTGIVILVAPNREAAEAIMNGDPAVQAGVFRARCSPIELSLVGRLTPTPTA